MNSIIYQSVVQGKQITRTYTSDECQGLRERNKNVDRYREKRYTVECNISFHQVIVTQVLATKVTYRSAHPYLSVKLNLSVKRSAVNN